MFTDVGVALTRFCTLLSPDVTARDVSFAGSCASKTLPLSPWNSCALTITLRPGDARTDRCSGALTLSCSLAFDMPEIGCTHPPVIWCMCVNVCVQLVPCGRALRPPLCSGCDLSRSCLVSFS